MHTLEGIIRILNGYVSKNASTYLLRALKECITLMYLANPSLSRGNTSSSHLFSIEVRLHYFPNFDLRFIVN